MPAATILVEHPKDCPWPSGDHRIVRISDYASNPKLVPSGGRIVNLCRTSGYLSQGYYGSLLAEARGHAVLPSVATLVGLNCRTLQAPTLDRLTRALAILLEECPAGVDLRRSLIVVFGRSREPRMQRLAALAFELYPSPLLAIDFDSGARRVKAVRPITGRQAADTEANLFRDALDTWLGLRRGLAVSRIEPRPRLAILHDPGDPLAPSKPRTLERFRKAGDALGLDVELIRHADLDRLPGFDGLFIRETTGILHASYRFAVAAEAAGIPVIDDPQSILRCCNKIHLAELLRRHGVPTPRTCITDGGDLPAVAATLGYPLVLKRPDGSNSRGVIKVETLAELEASARALLETSHLIVAQEYLYTPFDWRIAVLAGRPLFACRYRMAPGHWQILRHGADGRFDEGATEGVPLEEVPEQVVSTALRAAALVGDGLYGVDLKETAGGVFVIEVNDNPNIDAGLEDSIAGDELYLRILEEFLRRMAARSPALPVPPPRRPIATGSSGDRQPVIRFPSFRRRA